MLDYRYYRPVNARLKRQQHETSHARHLIKNVKMSMVLFEGADPITTLPFSRILDECDLEQILQAQDCFRIPSIVKERALAK